MWKFIKHFFYNFLYYLRNKETRHFIQRITHITGFMPYNVALYRLACLHISQKQKSDVGKDHKSNERLEYLGDAVLNLAVAHYLFRKYPLEKEGFLTEIRSRLVNRNSLNNLALKVGLDNLVVFQNGLKNIATQFQSINGNALEALVGAVYLDRGADICEEFILKNLLRNHFNIKEIIDTPQNFKSLLVQWGQQQDKNVRFESKQLQNSVVGIMFVTDLYVNDKIMMSAQDRSKKKSEQLVAQKAYIKFIKGKNWENKPKDHKKIKDEKISNNPLNTQNINQNTSQSTTKAKEKKTNQNLPKRENVIVKNNIKQEENTENTENHQIPNKIVVDVKNFVKKQEEQSFDFPSFEEQNPDEQNLPETISQKENLQKEKPKKKKRTFKKRKFTILKDQTNPTPPNNTNTENI